MILRDLDASGRPSHYVLIFSRARCVISSLLTELGVSQWHALIRQSKLSVS